MAALSRAAQGEIADRFIKALGIKTPSAEQSVAKLSGGTQQKVLLARWLATEPRLLILDEPTRGIDVGAKAEIEKLIACAVRAGHVDLIHQFRAGGSGAGVRPCVCAA